LKTIRPDITPDQAEAEAAENYAPHGRLWWRIYEPKNSISGKVS
jgi:hypothetical protein